jgi:hypothetical protein
MDVPKAFFSREEEKPKFTLIGWFPITTAALLLLSDIHLWFV